VPKPTIGHNLEQLQDNLHHHNLFSCGEVMYIVPVSQCGRLKVYWRIEVKSHAFLTTALEGGEWSLLLSGCFTSIEKSLGVHWIGGWVDPRASPGLAAKRNVPHHSQDLNFIAGHFTD
jgi:hypothetical protein